MRSVEVLALGSIIKNILGGWFKFWANNVILAEKSKIKTQTPSNVISRNNRLHENNLKTS